MPQPEPLPQPAPAPEPGPPQPGPGSQPARDFPVRQPHARLVQPGGRHRRPVPASLPEGAPALVLAVPSAGDDGLTGPTADIATVLRVDNPALDVRTARIDHGGRAGPSRSRERRSHKRRVVARDQRGVKNRKKADMRPIVTPRGQLCPVTEYEGARRPLNAPAEARSLNLLLAGSIGDRYG